MKPNRLRDWRIDMQKCLLEVERHEFDSVESLPSPLVQQLDNLQRDLRLMQGLKP
jgi:hypothetical protein